ncbi:MAG: glycosyltransferase family 9 protein [Myxococcaceae bacterium]
MRALLFLKGGIGDVVFALPLLADLRAGWPGVELVGLTHAQGKGVLDLCPDVAQTLSYGPMSVEPTLGTLFAALGGRHFDAALTPVRSPRAAWLLWKSRAPVRAGFGGGPEALLYTHRAAVRPFEATFSRRFERLAAALGLAVLGHPSPLVVSAERRERAIQALQASGWDGESPLVAVHAGGGWPTKQWPVEHAASLAAALARRHGLRTLLVGGEPDRPRAEAIAAASGAGALVQVGIPVDEALAQLDLCTAAVGLDSGLSHAGVALGLPTVSLFGPNEPSSIVLAPTQRLLIQEALSCRPCNRLGKLGCPLGHHRCMRDTTPVQVLVALEPLLALGERRLRERTSAQRHS